MKVAVLIPAFNEERSIAHVIKDIPRDLVDEIIVINNGSNDRTSLFATEEGARVIDEESCGYGNACLRGIQYLCSNNEKPDIVVFLDGDYSDHPEEMGIILKPVIEEDCDLVIGSRMIGNREKGAMLPQAVFGNKLATFLIRLLYGVSFTDLGPFRAIKFNRLLELNMQDRTYGWTVEMQVKAAKKGLKCKEVAVSYRKRIGTSKISGTLGGSIKAGYKIIWTIFKNI